MGKAAELGNGVLARIAPSERRRLEPLLEPVALTFKESLYRHDQRISHVYFVTAGMVSQVMEMNDDGDIFETGTIGREGFVGVHVFLGVSVATDTAFCQIPGAALRMNARTFVACLPQCPSLRELLGRYTHLLMAMTAQTAACNRGHALEARLARWLLMTHDRMMPADNFPLTQEFLGEMLGVRRPAVSLAGASLQRAGLIRYSRGRITIVERKGLEAVACECYRHITAAFTRVLGR